MGGGLNVYAYIDWIVFWWKKSQKWRGEHKVRACFEMEVKIVLCTGPPKQFISQFNTSIYIIYLWFAQIGIYILSLSWDYLLNYTHNISVQYFINLQRSLCEKLDVKIFLYVGTDILHPHSTDEIVLWHPFSTFPQPSHRLRNSFISSQFQLAIGTVSNCFSLHHCWYYF